MASVLLASAPAPARAQDDEGGGGDRVTVSAVLMTEGDAGLTEITRVGIGLRRGIADIEGVRFTHPADALAVQQTPDDVQAAMDDLDAIAELVRTGDPAEASRRARAAVEAFEQHLVIVRRSQLVDAYMLLALAECQRRVDRRCREGLERVVVVRESLEYDPIRYPEQHQALFDEVRAEAVERGLRGAIEIRTEPAGAEVYVDGRSIGPSPVVAEGLLVGDHYVTIKAVGFQKVITRANVNDSFQELIELELVPDERGLLLQRDLPRIREELGEARAGRFITGMTAYLFVNQVVLGVVRSGEGAIEVDLYLYDLRTRHLLNHVEARLTNDEEGMAEARRVGAALYEGVSLRGNVDAPDDGIGSGSQPIYRKWWFWTAVGAVVASGIVAIAVTSGGDRGTPLPQGFTRIDGRIE